MDKVASEFCSHCGRVKVTLVIFSPFYSKIKQPLKMFIKKFVWYIFSALTPS